MRYVTSHHAIFNTTTLDGWCDVTISVKFKALRLIISVKKVEVAIEESQVYC